MSYSNPVKKISVLISAVKLKLDRGEKLDYILESYVNLTIEEKDLIRNAFDE